MLFFLACAGTVTPEPVAAPSEPAFAPPSAERIVFEPATDKATPAMWVDGVRHELTYKVFAEDGQDIGGRPFGMLVDINGDDIEQCNNQDFAALIEVEGVTFHLSHVECHPSAIYITEMDAEMNPVWTRPVDMSGVRGSMLACSGDVTPWNTLLSSEEYEPNAAKAVPGEGVSDNWQGFNRIGNYFPDGLATVNPYDYGWIPEVTVLDGKGNTSVVKHFSMGRFSHELGVVAPDQKTVFLSDDGYGVGFFRFVADAPADLSAGTLYAAKFVGTAIEWVDLGHASNDEVDTSLTFGQMFTADNEGCTPIATQFGPECLSLVEGMDLPASRLETRRYAALMGATTELSKTEGIAIDEDRKRVYLAATINGKGMERKHPEFDVEGVDHIQAIPNGCGSIIAFNYTEDFTPTSWETVLAGLPMGAGCHPDHIANPDNITMLGDLVMVAEDTRNHDPNVLWAWDPDDDSLTPVVYAGPDGAEMAGIHHYPDVGWFTVTEQHGPRGKHPTLSAVLGPIPDL